VASCPICSILNEKNPLSIWYPSLELDMVVDMVNHSIGDLDHDLPLVTPTESFEMYYFHRVFLSSNYDSDHVMEVWIHIVSLVAISLYAPY
jgi:hypothetical protein